MNIHDIESSINHLENSGTTFENCEKLASLYVIRDHYSHNTVDTVVSEIYDVLPAYTDYINTKKRYQIGEVEKSEIQKKIRCVCKEIEELIQTMYRCTDMEEERAEINNMIEILKNFSKSS